MLFKCAINSVANGNYLTVLKYCLFVFYDTLIPFLNAQFKLLILYGSFNLFMGWVVKIKCLSMPNSSKHCPSWYPGTRGFLSPWRDKRRERKKLQEKTSGCGRCESHYYATRCHKNRLATSTAHLSVNNRESEYAYKVPLIRRQGQILTLVQIYWHSKINQVPRATRGFLIFLSSLLFSPLCGSFLRKPLAPRVPSWGQRLSTINS